MTKTGFFALLRMTETGPRAPALRKLAEPRRLEAYRFLSVLPAAVSEEARFPVGGNDADLPEGGSLRLLEALVLPHRELRIHLSHRFKRNGNHDQNGGAADG